MTITAETTLAIQQAQKSFFTNWQQTYLKDTSRIKLLEKSRRIGGTWIQAFEDVVDCLTKRGHGNKAFKVWFSSADESAAKEYIDYIVEWCEFFQIGLSEIGKKIIKGATQLICRFTNGNKITALSSNPKAMRSKGGKLILDEFAHHEDDKKMWQAAKPITQWGYDTRILSTHNGKDCLFFQFIQDIKTGAKKWGHHCVDIFRAVNDGLLTKIFGRSVTQEEIDEWLEGEKSNCGSELDWLQEYCCIATDENITHLPYELLNRAKYYNTNMRFIQVSGEEYRKYSTKKRLDFLGDLIIPEANDLYIGMDIGRKRNISAIWIIEKDGAKRRTRLVVELDKFEFSHQEEILYKLLELPKVVRAHIDATGLGAQLAENARKTYGNVVEVVFNAGSKERMATRLKSTLEDDNFEYKHYTEITEDLHSMQERSGSTHKIYDAPQRKGQKYHGDFYWAAALAVDASVPTGAESLPNIPKTNPATGIRGFLNGFTKGKIRHKLQHFM